MEVSLFAAVLCLGLLNVSRAAVAVGIGACPENRKPGEKWYPPGCQECLCLEGAWTCESCGTGQITYDPKNCYADYTPGKAFPGCCVPDVKCRGKPGFNKSRLLHDVSGDNEVVLNDAPVKSRKKTSSMKNKNRKKIKLIKLNKLKTLKTKQSITKSKKKKN